MNTFKNLVVALLLTAISSTSAFAAITDAQLFAWAAATYPQFFSGTPVTAQFPPYDIQYYPGSATFLAVNTTEGNVYVFGTVTGNVLTSVGALTAFAPTVSAWQSTLPDTSAYAGTYLGNYYWSGGAGGWTITIDSTGSVTGQGTATCTGICNNSANYPLSGSVSGNGGITFTTYGGDTCSGTIAASSGALSGTCNYVFNRSSGAFSGAR